LLILYHKLSAEAVVVAAEVAMAMENEWLPALRALSPFVSLG
jgi:hypothetical protein